MFVDESALADSLFAANAGRSVIPTPPDLRIEEGYSVQERAFRLGELPVAGWKLALTSQAAQAATGVDCPVVGRLSATDVKTAPNEVEMTSGPLYAEAELVITLARDLPSRTEPYDASEIRAAIGAIHAGIELCTSRFENDEVGVGLLIADNAFAHVLVLGDRLRAAWDSRLEAIEVTLRRSAAPPIRGSTSAVMGNPLHALVWLANWLSSRGETLRQGQVVATGSCTGVVEICAGDELRAAFANFGEATVSITPRDIVRRLR